MILASFFFSAFRVSVSRDATVLVAILVGISSGLNATEPERLRKPKHGSVYVVAHRGVHDLIPENTLAAYQKAIEIGCDFIEVDIRTTADGHLVSIHDSTIDKYTINGERGTVANMTLAELKKVDIGSRIGPGWKDQRIPTFEEIVELCRGKIGIYIDVKAAALADIHQVAVDAGMESDTIWYIPYGKVEELRGLSKDCWPMPDPGPELFLKPMLNKCKPQIVASTWGYYTPSFGKLCHDAGAIVMVDDNGPEGWPKLVEWGADGIQTDSPKALIDWLEKRKSQP